MAFRDNPGGAQYGKTLIGAHLIGGKLKGANAKDKIQSLNPAWTKDIVGEFPLGDEKDVAEACEAARAAFKLWKSVPAPVRGELVGKIGQLMREQKESLSRLLTREIGKPLRESRGEVQEAIDTCAFFQSEGRRLYGQTVPSELRNKELDDLSSPPGRVRHHHRRQLPLRRAQLEDHPRHPLRQHGRVEAERGCAHHRLRLRQLLREAGLPGGVLNVVYGTGPAAGAAVRRRHRQGPHRQDQLHRQHRRRPHDRRNRRAQPADPPSLELGGKNPMIVMRDADLDNAVTRRALGRLRHGRPALHLARQHHPPQDDRRCQFKKQFVEQARKLAIGDPLNQPEVLYGPIINERFCSATWSTTRWARSRRREAAVSGKGDRITDKNAPKGFCGNAKLGLYVTPTIYDNVAIGDALAQNEVFGPTVNIISGPTFDEAMETANRTSLRPVQRDLHQQPGGPTWTGSRTRSPPA